MLNSNNFASSRAGRVPCADSVIDAHVPISIVVFSLLWQLYVICNRYTEQRTATHSDHTCEDNLTCLSVHTRTLNERKMMHVKLFAFCRSLRVFFFCFRWESCFQRRRIKYFHWKRFSVCYTYFFLLFLSFILVVVHTLLSKLRYVYQSVNWDVCTGGVWER